MLFSNTDLYKGEWLDLVFKNRNHNYGAYSLRRENDGLLFKALGGTFLAFAMFGITVTVIAHNKAVPPTVKTTFIDLADKDVVFQAQPPKKIEPPKQELKQPVTPPKQVTTASVQTQVFVTPKPVPDDQADDIKALKQDVAVSNVENTEGVKGQLNTTAGAEGKEPGEGVDGAVDGAGTNEVLNVVQVMPEPIGGMEAWNKFLQKTLRYPAIAQEEGLNGKTFMSFIVEKDGSISNIEVVRKAGHGFDEESSRVLKLAKPWKPGMQNGKAVRVRYILPINFQVEAN